MIHDPDGGEEAQEDDASGDKKFWLRRGETVAALFGFDPARVQIEFHKSSFFSNLRLLSL